MRAGCFELEQGALRLADVADLLVLSRSDTGSVCSRKHVGDGHPNRMGEYLLLRGGVFIGLRVVVLPDDNRRLYQPLELSESAWMLQSAQRSTLPVVAESAIQAKV